jgi:hypothetical protein
MEQNTGAVEIGPALDYGCPVNADYRVRISNNPLNLGFVKYVK